MKEIEGKRTFRCHKCGKGTMTLYQWNEHTPVGVCSSCTVSMELDATDLQALVGLRCDFPGCDNKLESGEGSIVRISQVGSLIVTGEDVTTNGHDGLVMEWRLCEECSDYMVHIMGDTRLKQSKAQYLRYLKGKETPSSPEAPPV